MLVCRTSTSKEKKKKSGLVACFSHSIVLKIK